MTPSDDLQRLVERIEAASGPDREIDYRLFEFVRTDAQHCAYIEGKPYPAYTSSVDDALRLVPRFHGVDLTFWPLRNRARLLPLYEDGDRWLHRGSDPDYCADAATPALSICAAALKAKIGEASCPKNAASFGRARITQENSNGYA